MASSTVDLSDLRISNSKAKTYRRCPRQFKFKYVERLESKKKKRHLELGTWLHELLMVHYEGKDWRKRHKKLTRRFYASTFEEERDEFGDLPNEVERLMKAYLVRYRAEDRHFRVIDAELDEYITLPNGLRFNFIIDAVVEEAGYLWLWDHRAIGRFLDVDFMLLDAQLARYFYSAERMGYTPLGGVMFNEIRTKSPTIPKVLKSGQLSQAMNIDTDVFTYYQAIRRARHDPADYHRILKHLAAQQNKFFRRTRLPKDAPLMKNTMRDLIMTAQEIREALETRRFPRSPDKSCTWECDFKDLCIVEYFGGDKSTMERMNFKRRTRRG